MCDVVDGKQHTQVKIRAGGWQIKKLDSIKVLERLARTIRKL